MKKLFTCSLIATILLTTFSCIDHDQQKIGNHIDSTGLKNFKLTPELDLCLSFMAGKTNTSISSVGFNCDASGDSIIDYFEVSIHQDTVDVNHKDLSKEVILERIAADIKPMVEKYNLFDGIIITWVSSTKLGGNISANSEVVYKRLLKDIPDNGKYTSEMSGDTIIFKDYYYNGAQAKTGKVFNNKRVGYWTYWYPNGNKKREGTYIENEKAEDWKFWTETGVEEK